jgi:hypothetical protein
MFRDVAPCVWRNFATNCLIATKWEWNVRRIFFVLRKSEAGADEEKMGKVMNENVWSFDLAWNCARTHLRITRQIVRRNRFTFVWWNHTERVIFLRKFLNRWFAGKMLLPTGFLITSNNLNSSLLLQYKCNNNFEWQRVNKFPLDIIIVDSPNICRSEFDDKRHLTSIKN